VNSQKDKPIGVFDSGIGGLTVVKRITAAMPNENIVYFGDTARVPYGSKSNETVIQYSIENTQFLMEKDIKALVVACNTASSVAIPVLKQKFNLPIIGMIKSGSSYAVSETKNKKIGVIGTRATIYNKAYRKEINKINKKIEVYEIACPLFVPLAEEGWMTHKATYTIAEEYLTDLKLVDVDTLVLGCTHYPILVNVIQDVVGDKVKLIDSGVAAAIAVKKELTKLDLLTNSSSLGNVEYYVSDIPTKFKDIAQLFLGRPIEKVNRIDIDEFIKRIK